MKKVIFILITLLAFISCKNKTEEIPLLTDPDAINTHRAIFESLVETVHHAFKYGDAPLLYKNLDQESITYYDRLLTNARAKKLEGSYGEKSDGIIALMFLNDSELKLIDGQQLLQVILNYYIQEVDLDKNKEKEKKSIELEDLEIRGSIATANPTKLRPLKFTKENKQWKFNIIVQHERMDEISTELKKINNSTEKQAILDIITNGNLEHNPNIKRSFEEVWSMINK